MPVKSEQYPNVELLASGRWRARAWDAEAPNPSRKSGKGRRVTVPGTFDTAHEAFLAKVELENGRTKQVRVRFAKRSGKDI